MSSNRKPCSAEFSEGKKKKQQKSCSEMRFGFFPIPLSFMKEPRKMTEISKPALNVVGKSKKLCEKGIINTSSKVKSIVF